MTYVKAQPGVRFLSSSFGLAATSLDCFSFVLCVFDELQRLDSSRFNNIISHKSPVMMVDFLTKAYNNKCISEINQTDQLIAKKAGLLISLKWINDEIAWKNQNPAEGINTPTRHLMFYYTENNSIFIFHNTFKSGKVVLNEVPIKNFQSWIQKYTCKKVKNLNQGDYKYQNKLFV